MSVEENKAMVRRWIEELNKRNVSILDELMSPDFFHLHISCGVQKVTNNLWSCFPTLFPIGMRLLRTSSLKVIRCGIVLSARGHTKASFMV